MIKHNQDPPYDIDQRTHDIFESLIKEKNIIKANECTVLSSIMLVDNNNPKGKIIALSTGTKCLGKSLIVGQDGQVIHDSHAEVLCRRLLCLYLYNQIDSYLKDDKKNCIIELINNKYKLKADVQFHLYSSQSPCGNASLYKLNKNEINYSGAKVIENSIIHLSTKSGRSDLPEHLQTKSMSY